MTMIGQSHIRSLFSMGMALVAFAALPMLAGAQPGNPAPEDPLVAELLEAMNDKKYNPDARVNACQVLAKRGAKSAIPSIVQFLEELQTPVLKQQDGDNS